MRQILVMAAVVLASSGLFARYVTDRTASPPAPATAKVATPAARSSATGRTVSIRSDRRGHFAVEGRVDGRRLNFMVDTGASVIALTASDAARLGLHPARNAFTAPVQTANGTVLAARTTLDRVEIDDISVRDVAALIMPDAALSENLLGLSFLSRLRRFEYGSGKLVLEQ